MKAATPTLAWICDQLRALYGAPEPPAITDPFEQLLWENTGYLMPDKRRSEAFALLKSTVGLTPQAILRASDAKLLAVARLGGMHPEQRVERFRLIASLVDEELGGDLASVLAQSLKGAKKALRLFPGIGEPGAEKILLFAGLYPSLALESNGVRTLTRIGIAPERASYSTTYKGLQTALADQIGTEFPLLIAAHQLLREHGQTLCRSKAPECAPCPLKKVCVTAPLYTRTGTSQGKG